MDLFNPITSTFVEIIILSRRERRALKEIKGQNDITIGIQDKGSKFVVMDSSERDTEMKEQLENPMYYKTLDIDTSESYTAIVSDWSFKWLAKGQIN